MNTVDNLIVSMTQQISKAAGQSSNASGTVEGGQPSFQTLLQQQRQEEQSVLDADHTQMDEVSQQPAGQGGAQDLSLYYQQLLAIQVIPAVATPVAVQGEQTPNPMAAQMLTQVSAVAAPTAQGLAEQMPIAAPPLAAGEHMNQIPLTGQPQQQIVQPQQTAQAQQLSQAQQVSQPSQAVQPQQTEQPQAQTSAPPQLVKTEQTAKQVTQPVDSAEGNAKAAAVQITAPEQMQSGQHGETKLTSDPRQTKQEAEILPNGQESKLFPMADAVPLKVGETPVLDSTAPDLDVQLAKQVNSALETGSQRVEIKLSPDHLGEITVELTRNQDGSLHVALSAGTERGAALLEKHMGGLETLLAGTNRAPVQVEVQRQQESQQSQHQQPQEQERQGSRGGQQHQPRQQQQESEDFIQQLRLGLRPLDSTAS